MKNKLFKILTTTLLCMTISIPTFASVQTNDLEIYNNKLSMIQNEFKYGSENNISSPIYNSETKAKDFLTEINNYIKNNTSEDFQTECKNIIDVMERYREYQYNNLKEQEKQTGWGSKYGRDYSRINTIIYLDTSGLLLDSLNEYSYSFKWYINEYDKNHEHWKYEDGNWHYYDNNGDMLVNTIIDGYSLDCQGNLIQ